MRINMMHKDMTCRKTYENIGKIHQTYPEDTLTQQEWLKRHLEMHEGCILGR